MRIFRLSAIASALLLASLTAHGAAAGRVVVAVGDTVAVRNGRAIRLVTGSEVETGDTLKVGAQSNLQVRFTDDALVALRPDTEYRIDDYKFTSQPGEDRSFFSLLKGGVRAITGLIARVNRDNYGVKTPTATIGIRGTHFNLVQCGGDCRSNGGLADNGLYGGVTDGRIVVRNEAGEVEFGKAEFFHVATANAAPTPLLAPPSFLRDRLDGQAAARRKSGGSQEAAAKGETKGEAPAANGAATAGSGETTSSSGETTGSGSTESTASTDSATTSTAGTDDTSSTSTVTAPTASGEPITNPEVTTQPPLSTPVPTASAPKPIYTTPEQPVVQNDVAPPPPPPPVTWTTAGANAATGVASSGTTTGFVGAFAFAHASQEKVTNDGSVFPLTVKPLDFNMQAWSVSNAPFTETFVDQNTANTTFGQTTTETGTESFSKTAATDTGGAAGAGNVFWGRYAETSVRSITSGPKIGSTFSETRDVHWLVGDPVVALPTTGKFVYNWVGGTIPTYVTTANGSNPSPAQQGIMGSGGTLSVDFTGQSIATTSPITWSTPNAAYSLSFSSPFPSTSASSFSGSGITLTAEDVAPINASTTCLSGCLVTAVAGTVSPHFTGAGGEGLALGISTVAPLSLSVSEFTASVQAYQKGVETTTASTPASTTTSTTSGPAIWTTANASAATGVATSGFSGPFAFAEAFQETLSNDGSVFPLALSPLDFNMNSWSVSNAPFTETFVDQNTASPTFDQTVTQTGTESFSKTASTDTGGAVAAGNAFWGRYAETSSRSITSGPKTGSTFSEARDVHWLVGDPVVALPTSGKFAYNWVGGTIPTYVTTANGSNPSPAQQGTMGSGGALSVDFTTEILATTSPITWSTPNASYSLSFSSPFPSTSASSFTGSGIIATANDVAPISTLADCLSGCLSISAPATVTPQFTGAGGEGLALGISTVAPLSASVSEFTASVQAYQKGLETTPPPTATWTTGSAEAATGVSAGGSFSGPFASAEAFQETLTNDGSVFPLTMKPLDFNMQAWSVSNAPFTETFVDQNTASPTFGQTVTQTGTESFSKTAATDTGSAPTAGNLFWGRYAEASAEIITGGPGAGTTRNEEQDVHWMLGDPVTALPSAGTFAYDWVGGTTPTYVTTANGTNPSPAQQGTLGSGGALSVNFTNQIIATTSPITWSTPNASYSLSFSSPFPATTGSSFSGSGITATASDVAPISTPVTCLSGCLVTSVAGSVTAQFMGAGGGGLALGISSTAPLSASVSEFTASVQGYQKGLQTAP